MAFSHRSWFWIGFAAVAAIAAVLATLALIGRSDGQRAFAHSTGSIHVEIDAVEDSGWCNTVDSVGTLPPGATSFRVAVCVTDAPRAIGAFSVDVVYNDQNAAAPEIDCGNDGDLAACGSGNVGLDDNPDANTGSTTYSTPSLGDDGWDCGALGLIEPQGDADSTAGVTNGRATISCLSPGTVTLTSGPLAVVELNVLGGGTETLTLEEVQIIDAAAVEIGSCSPVLTTEIECLGAEINKGGGPVATPAPTETPTEAPVATAVTPTATPSVVGPGPTATPIPPGMEAVELFGGCQFEAWTGADGTAPEELTDLVGPAGNLRSLWAQQPVPTWKGFSPQFPEASNLGPVNRLDVLAFCTYGPGTFVRPVV